jgi:hypothetical protein
MQCFCELPREYPTAVKSPEAFTKGSHHWCEELSRRTEQTLASVSRQRRQRPSLNGSVLGLSVCYRERQDIRVWCPE